MINKIKKMLNNEQGNKSKAPDDYFVTAKSWADEFYTSAIASRNKWRALSIFILTPIIFLLLICMTFLIPSQHIEPLMINHYADGETIVTPIKQHYEPKDSAEVESDIARYIRFRESYSANTYDYSYRLIHLMSSQSVYGDYQELQNSDNKNSPINLLGKSGYETVKIESIVFLDNEDKNIHNNRNVKNKHTNKNLNDLHKNLAQVDFVVITHNNQNSTTTSKPLAALISWGYRGISNDPNDRWMDWNGFTVTHYQVTNRNV